MDEKLQELLDDISNALQQRYDICRNAPDDEDALNDSYYALKRAYIMAQRYCEKPLFDSKEMLW